MLHNPKWDKVKLDPFDINTLILWLERQSADTPYCYVSTGECLLAQYFTAMGFTNVVMFTSAFMQGPDRREIELPPHFNKIARAFPFTFGAALARARKVATNDLRRMENPRA